MIEVTIARGIRSKDPFRRLVKHKADDIVNRFASKALARFADHGKSFTGGIDEEIEHNGRADVSIGSRDQRFIWTTLGTKDHYVQPRTAVAMVYTPLPYARKTIQNSVHGNPSGGRSAGSVIFRQDRYRQSGIDATEVNKTIAQEIRAAFVSEIRKSLGLG